MSNDFLLMLKFFLTEAKVPSQKELENKTYLVIRSASGYVDTEEPHFILEASPSQSIDLGFNYI